MIDAALLACASEVAPQTLQAIIQVESRGNPLALNVNKLPTKPPRAATLLEAAATARFYISKGYSVDLGLMQVNSRNLAKLGLSVEQVLEPCTNIRAGAAILTPSYQAAARIHGEGQTALLAALSAYNTGTFTRGFSNGYVGRYFASGPAFSPTQQTRKAPAQPVADRYATSSFVFIRKGISYGPAFDRAVAAADAVAQPQ